MTSVKKTMTHSFERDTRKLSFSASYDPGIDLGGGQELKRDGYPDEDSASFIHLDSIGNILQGGGGIDNDNDCADSISSLLSSILQEEMRHIASSSSSSYANNEGHTVEPVCSDATSFEPIPLEVITSKSDGQKIVSSDEEDDDIPLEAFPEDDSYYHYDTMNITCQEEGGTTVLHPSSTKASVVSLVHTTCTSYTTCDRATGFIPVTTTSEQRNWFVYTAPNEEKNFHQHLHTPMKNVQGMVAVSSDDEDVTKQDKTVSCVNIRDYHKDKWEKRYNELRIVFKDTGRSSVHHNDVSKKGLARWIKRQRYQYKLLHERKTSTMTKERIEALQRLNFVWDSHSTAWDDRIQELKLFKDTNKHCNVPYNYPANKTLASWIKYQRRQYRLMERGGKSNISSKRICQLRNLGFQFSPRETLSNV
jgi:hypothetical protein